MITVIAAAGENNELGKNNDLLWHLPDDFKRFKSHTTGHYIIMGRKTFESFPKPLPNRTHIIITRSKDYKAPEGCIAVNNLEKAIEVCPKNETIFIIGGGEIYKQSISIADCIELTRVHENFDADTFFPEINSSEWKLLSSEFHDKDEKHKHTFSFETYQKIKK
ncbi:MULTISPECIES: dihydrofolate reductase [Flavobacterium]|uniref:Dihydrofolate reductase n=1 Tax=Flavobacterium hankyongi TaxID=1176532 RepID=A0ABP8ZK58_9FLAO|nr:dihydrofolate reductase [Flavobacterium sp. N1846]